MSRRELIKQLKKKNSTLTESESAEIINVISENITKILKDGNNLEIRGFGRWFCKRLKENFNARNPATNELIYKPEKFKVRFKASKNLKKKINR